MWRETKWTVLGRKQPTRIVKGVFPADYRYIIHLMQHYREQTHLVVTDRSIFPFYAGLPVHPHLASCSWKRQCAGFLTTEDFINIIRKEQPELILFARFLPLRNKIVLHTRKSYELKYQDPRDTIRLYMLKHMIKSNKRN